MCRMLLLTGFTLIICLFSHELKSQEELTPQADELQQQEVLLLVDERLFDSTFSGVSSIDVAEVRANLIRLQPDISTYQKPQQAFYWFNLSLASKALALPSTQTIPAMNNALNFAEGLEPQHHFKILITAIDVYFAYQQHEQVLQSVEQLRTLTQHELNPQTKRLPVKYENLRAFALYQSGMLKEAETSYSQLIHEAELHNAEADINWYRLLAAIHQQKGDVKQQLAVMNREYQLQPSKNLQEHIKYLQNH